MLPFEEYYRHHPCPYKYGGCPKGANQLDKSAVYAENGPKDDAQWQGWLSHDGDIYLALEGGQGAFADGDSGQPQPDDPQPMPPFAFDALAPTLVQKLQARGMEGELTLRGGRAPSMLLSACTVRALIKPATKVINEVDAALRTAAEEAGIGPSAMATDPVYTIGLHARYAGRSTHDLKKRMHPDDVAQMLHCAQLRSANRTVIWLLATDVPRNFFTQACKYAEDASTGTPFRIGVAWMKVGKVEHIKKNTDSTNIFRLWCDWWLLYESSECIMSDSGFSRTACQASPRRHFAGGEMVKRESCPRKRD